MPPTVNAFPAMSLGAHVDRDMLVYKASTGVFERVQPGSSTDLDPYKWVASSDERLLGPKLDLIENYASYLTSSSFGLVTNTQGIPTVNRIYLYPFLCPGRCTPVYCSLYNSTNNANAEQDFGMYRENTAGDWTQGLTRICSTGPIAITGGAGVKSLALTNTGTVPWGLVFFAWTASTTTAQFRGITGVQAVAVNPLLSYATGGGTTLPATIAYSTIVTGQITGYPYLNFRVA